MPQDFRVKVSVKNNRILKLMEGLGIATQSELALKAGLTPSSVGMILSFKKLPLFRGKWTYSAKKIADVLFSDPEDLWPEHMANLRSNGPIVFSTDEAGIRQLQAPSERQLNIQDLDKLFDAARLNEREKNTLALRFGLKGEDETTLRQIGTDIERSVERIRSVEFQALRKLYWFCRKKGLEFNDFYS